MSYEGMNWYDLVRKYFPKADDKLCTEILWKRTDYPVSSPEIIEKQLQEIKEVI
jgi:hypothetical protein